MTNTVHCFLGFAWIALALWGLYVGFVVARASYFGLQAGRYSKLAERSRAAGGIDTARWKATAQDYADRAEQVGMPWPIR